MTSTKKKDHDTAQIRGLPTVCFRVNLKPACSSFSFFGLIFARISSTLMPANSPCCSKTSIGGRLASSGRFLAISSGMKAIAAKMSGA